VKQQPPFQQQKKPTKPHHFLFRFSSSTPRHILKCAKTIQYWVKAMNAKATVRLRLSSEKQLTTILDALAPEANRPVNVRAKTVLERDGDFAVLKVEAKDTVALRAALNAYLRWIGSTVKVLETIEHAS
jgi:tRNA threonylcarbamoyladenosine modification (KEOPS) complex  Pcc1 subunit